MITLCIILFVMFAVLAIVLAFYIDKTNIISRRCLEYERSISNLKSMSFEFDKRQQCYSNDVATILREQNRLAEELDALKQREHSNRKTIERLSSTLQKMQIALDKEDETEEAEGQSQDEAADNEQAPEMP